MKIKRDTTRDLFNAVLQLVKDNGCYDKAEAIMDYVLPEVSEYRKNEYIELSAYEFDFYASAQFGGNEGIYISCWLKGKYTENELKRFNQSTRQLETETIRNVGTFKTLRTDLEAMQIMGELCGSLVYYASKYVNANLDRYTPVKELKWQDRHKKCDAARKQYISKLAENMASAGNCETCADKSCKGKQDGCNKGIVRFVLKEVVKHCSITKYKNDERTQYFDWLDSKYNVKKDSFGDYVTALMAEYPDSSIYQAVGYVFVWLCTREQDFMFEQEG
jgi:hypothetical protein